MDPAQLDELYTAHSGTVYAFAVRLTGHEAAAKDLLQTVFLSVARRPRFLIRNPRSFLLRCTHRAYVDSVRRDAVRQRTTEAFGVLFPALSAVDHHPESEQLARLTAAVDALPPEQQTVVHLKIWEDQTFQQIARILGLNANTVASRYRYALNKLREIARLEDEP